MNSLQQTSNPTFWSSTQTATQLSGQRIAGWFRGLLASFKRARDLARAIEALDELDDATLRDLGIARSEAGSYYAEAAGLTPATRTRIIQAQWSMRGD